jgi:hypothetical protein
MKPLCGKGCASYHAEQRDGATSAL